MCEVTCKDISSIRTWQECRKMQDDKFTKANDNELAILDVHGVAPVKQSYVSELYKM